MGMFSLWGLMLVVGGAHAVLMLLLSVPYPRFLSRALCSLTGRVFWVQVALLAVCAVAGASAYHSCTVKYPLLELQENVNNQNYNFLLTSHFRHQRNMYIALFSLLMIWGSMALGWARRQLLQAQDALERAKND